MENQLEIELLYFEACPSWKQALETLQSVLTNLNLDPAVSLIRVETPEEALRQRFIGSPTIRVNGEDLFSVDQADFALGCRVYPTEEGLRGWPTEQMLSERLSLRDRKRKG
jgi:hypothetical protein